ncbi:MAG TPA: hypothetical protein VJ725_32385 [Thermoanaerobaculia bacterium]|nr:hypothetical protein [Thermoanaerobaculia bacterium]
MPWDRRPPFAFRSTFFLPLLAVLLLASGCASVRPKPADPEDLWKLYEQAVEAAKYPAPEHISKSLVPIATFTPGLVWDESGQKVLMVTWAQSQFFKGKPPYETTIPVPAWLTPVPFARQFCQKTGLHGDALRLRIAQRLGLPPTASNDVFVQMWVDPHLFFRPCPDPEVNDAECQVNLTAGPADTSSSCPWSAALEDQLSEQFVTVSEDHLKWMCSNWQDTYKPGEPRKSYPWTALGYTYDWGAVSHRGESEFVLPPNKPVVIESVTPMDVYCASGG